MPLPSRSTGNAAIRAGHYQEAEDIYTSCLQNVENHSERTHLLCNRAQARLKLGRWEGALQDAEECLSLDDMNIKAKYRKASALQQLGRLDDAATEATKSLGQCTSSSDAAQFNALLEIIGRARISSLGNKGLAVSFPSSRLLPEPSLFPADLKTGWEIVQAADSKNENLMVMFHGLGDSARNFATFAKKVALPSTISLLLQGPVPLYGHPAGSAWYRQLNDEWETLPLAGVLPSLRKTVKLVQELLHALNKKANWPFSRIHLFGFSQGGTLALEAAKTFSGHEALGSCVSVSGPLLDLAAGRPKSAMKATPVLITHGKNDDQVPFQTISDSVQALKQAGCSTELVRVEGKGHAMVANEAEVRALMTFWAKSLRAAPPPPKQGEEYMEVDQASQ